MRNSEMKVTVIRMALTSYIFYAFTLQSTELKRWHCEHGELLNQMSLVVEWQPL